jgi:hypothetical protein
MAKARLQVLNVTLVNMSDSCSPESFIPSSSPNLASIGVFDAESNTVIVPGDRNANELTFASSLASPIGRKFMLLLTLHSIRLARSSISPLFHIPHFEF